MVEDCLDGMSTAFKKSNAQCDVFNLGCEFTLRVRDIAQIVIEEMGLKNVKVKYTGGVRGWPGDATTVIFNLEKIARLGWKAKYDSKQAVRVATRRLLGKAE